MGKMNPHVRIWMKIYSHTTRARDQYIASVRGKGDEGSIEVDIHASICLHRMVHRSRSLQDCGGVRALLLYRCISMSYEQRGEWCQVKMKRGSLPEPRIDKTASITADSRRARRELNSMLPIFVRAKSRIRLRLLDEAVHKCGGPIGESQPAIERTRRSIPAPRG